MEVQLRDQGFLCVAGIDEVGRGPLAGPVVAAAVVLPPSLPKKWTGLIRDSKQLSAQQRATAYDWLIGSALSYGIGASDTAEIDALGIAVASRLAMVRAVEGVEPCPDHLLIDAFSLPGLAIPQTPIIKGDAICSSIAAASIIAKVTRDRLMETVFEEKYPGYGFASHKGYGTAEHMAALAILGPTPIHRMSFAPLRERMRL